MDLDEAFLEGYVAAHKGGKIDCPYAEGFELFDAWAAGFEQGHSEITVHECEVEQ